MTAEQVLNAFRARGVEIRADGEHLSVRAPQGVLTPADAAQLRERKQELLAELARVGRWGTALSAQQERLWYFDQVETDLSAYVLPGAFRIDGPLDVDALRAALQSFVERHELGRVRIVAGEAGPVVELAPQSCFAFARIESAEILDDPTDLTALARWIETAGDVAMPLGAEPLIRFTLIAVHPELHVLMLVVHHAVWDGWCFDIFLRDVGELYAARCEARVPVLPRLVASYADFVRAQRQRHDDAVSDTGRQHWAQVLDGSLPDLELAADRPRPAQMTYAGRRVPFAMSPEALAAVRALASAEHTTVFVCLLAVYFTLLHRATGQDDVIVAVPVQGRTQPEFEDVVGFFVNTVTVRGTTHPDMSFRDLLQQIGSQFRAALEHQDTPFEWLAQTFGRRDPSRTPIFQTMFTHQFTAQRNEHWRDIRVRSFSRGARTVTTDISLWVREYEDRLDGGLDFRSDLFDDASAAALAAAYHRILDTVVVAPQTRLDAVPLLDDVQRVRETTGRAGPARVLTASDSLLARVERYASDQPEAVAITCGSVHLTYRELWRHAEALAAMVQAHQVAPGDPVVVLADRTEMLPAVVLGVLLAGAVYVPCDPTYPVERLRYMAHDSGARVAIVSAAHAGLASDIGLDAIGIDVTQPETTRPRDVVRTALTTAYRIYTSGSTGLPKAVDVAHGALDNFLAGIGETLEFSSADTLLAVTTVSFDISLLELLLPIACGGRVSIATSDEAVDAAALAAMMVRDDVTVLQATPATWRLLLDDGWQGSLRLALCGGEAFPPLMVAPLRERAQDVWNLYGPTETTVWSAAHRLTDEGARVPVGQPLLNTQIYVLDARQQPVPQGVAGDVWIGGAGVALGYWNRGDMTRERFVHDPFTGAASARMYRTGDRGRWRADGALEHLGRADTQVKVNGYRIELGEIEAALEAIPEVRQAAADARGLIGDRRLMAWVRFHDGSDAPPTPSELRRTLRRSLPAFMVPAMIIALDELPLTLNGKLDRRALPDPLEQRRDARAAYAPPTGDLETVIAEEWCRLLAVDRVSRHDNFFELGGHSLLSLRAVAAIARRADRQIDPRRFFFSTLAQLAE
jgi:amino acid adenylation domain-containing protein